MFYYVLQSSNGTTINSRILGKNASSPIADNDIIAFTDNIKYRVQYSLDPHEHNSNKRKRIDNSSHENVVPKKISPLEDRNQNCDAEKSGEFKDKISDFYSTSGINLISDELKREKAANKTLKEESLAMQDKIMDLEVDLYNKISANVGLELVSIVFLLHIIKIQYSIDMYACLKMYILVGTAN